MSDVQRFVFDLTTTYDIETLLAVTIQIVPISDSERKLYIRDTTGRLFTKEVVSRLHVFSNSFSERDDYFSYSDGSFQTDLKVLDGLTSYAAQYVSFPEEQCRDDLQQNFLTAVLDAQTCGSRAVTDEMMYKARKAVDQLRFEKFVFPKFIRTPDGSMAFELESQENSESHIPACIFYAERLSYLLGRDYCPDQYEHWYENKKKELAEERQFLIDEDDQKIKLWDDLPVDELEAPFRRTILDEPTTLVTLVQMMMPFDEARDHDAMQLLKTRKRASTDPELHREKVARFEAYAFHRCDMFVKKYGEKFTFKPTVEKYLKDGRDQYQRQGRNFYRNKDLEFILDQRLQTAYTNWMYGLTPMGNPRLADAEGNNDEPLMLGEYIKKLKVDGTIIPVIDLTDENDEKQTEAIRQSTNKLALYFSTKPEQLPPADDNAAVEEDDVDEPLPTNEQRAADEEAKKANGTIPLIPGTVFPDYPDSNYTAPLSAAGKYYYSRGFDIYFEHVF
jgi:hypothetical protein